jgi:hypothetical protein
MKFLRILSLAISGVMISNLPLTALEANSVSSHDSQIILAQTINQSATQTSRPTSDRDSQVLTEEQLKTHIQEFKEANNCQLKGEQKQKQEGELVKTLLNCVDYSFEVIDVEGSTPATALTLRRYPILVLQKGDEYKVKFSREAKMANPRIIIIWTKEGSNEFGDQYTPAKRAQIVTEKFNQYFIRDAKIEIPNLTKGIVNNQAVICAADEGNCNEDNILWTLKSSNRRSDIIVQLNLAFKGEAASAVYESDDPYQQKELENSIDMAKLVDDFVIKGLEQLQAQQSDAQIVDELASSDNWDAIQSE